MSSTESLKAVAVVSIDSIGASSVILAWTDSTLVYTCHRIWYLRIYQNDFEKFHVDELWKSMLWNNYAIDTDMLWNGILVNRVRNISTSYLFDNELHWIPEGNCSCIQRFHQYTSRYSGTDCWHTRPHLWIVYEDSFHECYSGIMWLISRRITRNNVAYLRGEF